MDKFRDQREPPHLRIPYKVMDLSEWSEFIRTPESVVWFSIVRHTIRAMPREAFGKKLYNEYFKNGILVSAYKLDIIAKRTGFKSKGRVSDLISRLVEKGYIKRHFNKWRGRKIVVYEVGIHDNGVHEHETFHLYRELLVNNAKKEIKKYKIEP
jgi:hypothetical protein